MLGLRKILVVGTMMLFLPTAVPKVPKLKTKR
jgi:hypothetical protein